MTPDAVSRVLAENLEHNYQQTSPIEDSPFIFTSLGDQFSTASPSCWTAARVMWVAAYVVWGERGLESDAGRFMGPKSGPNFVVHVRPI
jgi:hypothetical protein